jgi:hypothetical protein
LLTLDKPYFMKNHLFQAVLLFAGINASAQTKLPVIVATVDAVTSIRTDESDEVGRPWCTMNPRIGEVTSSSSLKTQGTNTYSSGNVSDCDINTSWVEAKADYGIGEYLEFSVGAGRIEEDRLYMFDGGCDILNGYAKNEKAWKDNSRVKKLKIYHNGNPICMVELKDSRKIQSFDFGKFFDLSEMQLAAIDSTGNDVMVPIKGSDAEN